MKTGTFSIDNVGEPDAIIVDSDCRFVVVYEQNQAGTTDYDVYAPNKSDTPVRRPAGAKTVLTNGGAGWFKGATVGFLAAVTAGTYTFAKEEHQSNPN